MLAFRMLLAIRIDLLEMLVGIRLPSALHLHRFWGRDFTPGFFSVKMILITTPRLTSLIAKRINGSLDSVHHKNNPKIFKQREWVWESLYLSPFAYNEASQTMYMQLPGIVVTYNTNTRVLEQVCTFKFPGNHFTCCSFLPLVFSGQSQPSEANVVVEWPMGEGLSSSSSRQNVIRHKSVIISLLSICQYSISVQPR